MNRSRRARNRSKRENVKKSTKRNLEDKVTFGYVNSENPDIYTYESIVAQYVAAMKEEGMDFIKDFIRTLAYIVDKNGRLMTVCNLDVNYEPQTQLKLFSSGFPRVYVSGLITPKRYRNKGYASMLLSKIHKDVMKNNMYQVYLAVDKDKLQILRPFYESNGFKYAGGFTFHKKNKGFDASNFKYNQSNTIDTEYKILDDLVFYSRYVMFNREEVSAELVLHEYRIDSDRYQTEKEFNKNIIGLNNMEWVWNGYIPMQIIVFNRSKRQIDFVCCYRITSFNNYRDIAPFEEINVIGYTGGEKNKKFVAEYLSRIWNDGKLPEDFHGIGQINFTPTVPGEVSQDDSVILYDVNRYKELLEFVDYMYEPDYM